MKRRALVVVLLPAVLCSPVLLLGSPAAGATACANFNAVAAADGVRVAVDSPGFIVVEHVDAGAPVAQVLLDSYGTSTGYAAYPDPSEEALSAIPLAGVPRTTYPLVAESQYPTNPEASVDTPAVTMSATSAPHAVEAVAQSGVSVSDVLSSTGLVQAKASATCAEDGTVTAVGESSIEGVNLGEGTLRIGRIHSMATVVVAPDGTPTVDSDLEISQVTIAGQTVGFGPEGLTLGGTSIPLGENPLVEVLGGLGANLTYLEAEPQADGRGVTAPGVRLTLARDVTGAAPTVVTYTFGRALATADATAIAPTPTTDGVSSIPPRATPTGSVSRPTSSGSAPVVTSAPATASTPAAPASVEAALPTRVFFSFSVWSIYAVLVVGGVLALSGALFFKTVGVRLRWT